MGAYLGTYLREKGKNTATKEDIAEITHKVEEVRTGYLAELETLKVTLSLLSKKQGLLFDEKIRVFKKLQAKLTSFKKYCYAAQGELSPEDLRPNFDSLAEEDRKSALVFVSELEQIMQEDFIFLSDKSREVFSELMRELYIMPSMELATMSNKDDPAFTNDAIAAYRDAMDKIDICLRSLYEELEFTSH